MSKIISVVRKLHAWLGGAFAIFILFFAITSILLVHRDDIRNLIKVGNAIPQKYNFSYSQALVSIDKAVGLAQESVGKKILPKRIEMRYDRGTLIYRVRFEEAEVSGAEASEVEVTIDALTGRAIIPAYQPELKAILEDIHAIKTLKTSGKWLLDILTLGIILSTIAVFILHLKLIRVKSPFKTKFCLLHRWLGVVVAIPVLIFALTGIVLNHEDFLKRLSKAFSSYKATIKTARPTKDFRYDKLPITVEKAIDIAQTKFPRKKELRRVILSYNYGTMVYSVEFQEGMRQGAVIDAYTGQTIRPYNSFELEGFIKNLHQLYLFGRPSKYLSDILCVFWIIVAIINLWCPAKRKC